MKLYVATYDDGDYYCEAGHIIGLFSTRELAEAACAEAKEKGVNMGSFIRDVYETGIGEYELDKVEPE